MIHCCTYRLKNKKDTDNVRDCNMEKLKPMRFSSEQLITAKKNFGHMLGAGGCGAVYRAYSQAVLK
ncbi:hypothetical protein AMTR_s00019p00228440 [Amborella trichopoda]|uniref:Uncharacterized protein n=1 Tax=Amborella trichopoda TaxID=13333 RepID=W1PH87_AMBTC|nr:hypothetical protein AMTR_s00019p00228440 [Amborella trichopoda]